MFGPVHRRTGGIAGGDYPGETEDGADTTGHQEGTMSLIAYEGPCGVCGQRITRTPVANYDGGVRNQAPAYVFRHDGMLEPVSGTAASDLHAIGKKIHAENQDH
jgi:hypothetical protein